MTSIRSGLCSITFRALTTKEVLSVAVEAGLDGIEWGADVHVPAGELDVAADVADRCLDAGLACPSYGTYVVAGRTPGDEVARVVDTALALGVSTSASGPRTASGLTPQPLSGPRSWRGSPTPR